MVLPRRHIPQRDEHPPLPAGASGIAILRRCLRHLDAAQPAPAAGSRPIGGFGIRHRGRPGCAAGRVAALDRQPTYRQEIRPLLSRRGVLYRAWEGASRLVLRVYVLGCSSSSYSSLMTTGDDNNDTTKKLEDSDVAVACLDYTLAPGATYPSQLIEASLALQHVLRQPGITPKNLIVGGDSAGGTLTAQLLSHLIHPHPHPQAARIELSEPLAGAFLVSPWLGSWHNHHHHQHRNTPKSSWHENRNLDMLSPSIVNGIENLNFSGTTWPRERAESKGVGLAARRATLVAARDGYGGEKGERHDRAARGAPRSGGRVCAAADGDEVINIFIIIFFHAQGEAGRAGRPGP